MIGSSKNKRENYPRKCFWKQEKEARVKFNPGLSANRPSNNWALWAKFWMRGSRQCPIMWLAPVAGRLLASCTDFLKCGFCCGFCEEWSCRSWKLELWPNTSQANYFEGFWRITSKKNRENRGKKTVRLDSPSRPCLAHILSDTLQTLRIPSCFAFYLQSLAYFDDSYQ